MNDYLIKIYITHLTSSKKPYTRAGTVRYRRSFYKKTLGPSFVFDFLRSSLLDLEKIF